MELKKVKLYELPRNSPFILYGNKYTLGSIDGMYSYCTDSLGRVIHILAYQEVEIETNIKDEEDFINV